MQAVADGKYDEGIAHLESAYDTLPHPNVLYNIGLAHMYAGRSDEAISYFERYKETAPPSDAAEIDILIASLRGKEEEAVAAAQSTQGGGSTGKADQAAAIETAAREVRRMAEETENDGLKRQADQLDATAKALRAGQPIDGQTTTPTTPTEVQKPVQLGRETKQATREGLYEEEVVSASRFAQSPLDAPNATAIITAQDIRMTGLTNLTDLLRRVAGVELNQVSPTQAEVSIRGLNRRQSNKVLLLVDGRSYRLDFLGTAWWNQLPYAIEDVERIEIIRGPASALYGADAFSGVVNVILRKPGEGTHYVTGQYGTQNTARTTATFVGRNGKLSYRYGFGYYQTDNAVVPVGRDRIDVTPLTDSPNTASKGAFGNGEMVYDLRKDSSATVGVSTYYGSNTIQGLSQLGQVTVPNALRTKTYATLTTPIGLRISSWYDRSIGGSGPSFLTPGAIDVNGDGLKQDLADVDVSWSGSGKVLVPQTFTVGAGYRYKHIAWVWLDDKHTQHHFGGYIQDVLELAKPLKLQLGARVDSHPLLDAPQFSPRGSLVYRFLGEQSLRLSIGRAFRGPSFLESYVQRPNAAPLRGVAGIGVGNDNLKPESIVSYELGYQNQASDYFSLEANVYYNTVKDAILFTDIRRFTLQQVGDDSPGNQARYDPNVDAFPLSTLGFTNERSTFQQIGGELGARIYPVAGLDLYSNYSISDTSPLREREIDPVRKKEQQTSLHKVNAGVQYRSRFGLDLSADLAWFSKQVWVEQVTDLDRGVRFQTFKQPSFTYVNARIGYRMWNDRLDLGVVGTNLGFVDRRQHPFGQPIDTRVFGSALLRF